MKLLCINDEPWYVGAGPAYLELVEVLRENDCGYYLIGYPSSCWYAKRCFIPISDIDESTFIRELNTHTQTV